MLFEKYRCTQDVGSYTKQSKNTNKSRNMKTAVLNLSVIGAVLCVQLLFINGSFGQTSGIGMGSLSFPVIYNQTIHIPAVHRPWYKRFAGWFTRSPAPIRNVTYTFPPSPPPSATNQVSMIRLCVCDFWSIAVIRKIFSHFSHNKTQRLTMT